MAWQFQNTQIKINNNDHEWIQNVISFQYQGNYPLSNHQNTSTISLELDSQFQILIESDHDEMEDYTKEDLEQQKINKVDKNLEIEFVNAPKLKNFCLFVGKNKDISSQIERSSQLTKLCFYQQEQQPSTQPQSFDLSGLLLKSFESQQSYFLPHNISINQKMDPSKQVKIISEAVGLIRVTFYNSKTKIQSIAISTGFLIDKCTVVTAEHCVFKEDAIATKIEFIPGIKRTAEVENNAVYKCSYTLNNIEKGSEGDNLHATDFAVIYLDKEIQILNYFKLKKLTSSKLNPSNLYKKMYTIGYPNNNLLENDLNPKNINQIITKGPTDIQIKDQEISYALQTKVGNSGSPVIAFTQQNQLLVVGIHSRKGNDGFGIGTFLSQKVLEKIQQFQYKMNGEKSFGSSTDIEGDFLFLKDL